MKPVISSPSRLLSLFLALLLLLTLPVSLFGCAGDEEDEWEVHPVSEGLITYISLPEGEGDQEPASPMCCDLTCAYLFETNVYELDNVTMIYYYGLGPSFAYYYRQNHLRMSAHEYYGDIIDQRIYVTLSNPKLTKELGLTGQNRYPYLLEAEPGIAANGIYLCEEIPFESIETLPLEQYGVRDFWEGNCKVTQFAHGQRITIPKELFDGNEGTVSLSIVEYVKYKNQQNCSISYSNHSFSYVVDGEKLYISDT